MRKVIIIATPFVLLLIALVWLYSAHDRVHWYFWPKQGTSIAMWKGENHYYRSLGVEWSHGQTWDETGEIVVLWHWPTFKWVNVDLSKLIVLQSPNQMLI